MENSQAEKKIKNFAEITPDRSRINKDSSSIPKQNHDHKQRLFMETHCIFIEISIKYKTKYKTAIFFGSVSVFYAESIVLFTEQKFMQK